MSRKVSYKVVGRHSVPGDRDSEIKYYACVKSTGDISINEMAERMQLESTLTKADILAVLASLENVVVDSLKRGEIVRLADLGTLSIGINSEGTDIEKNFVQTMIKRAHVNFRPGNALKSCLKELSFSKIATPESAAQPENDPQEQGNA